MYLSNFSYRYERELWEKVIAQNYQLSKTKKKQRVEETN